MIRTNLPLLDERPLLTDGGLETVLLFQDGIDLPAFAAFPLVETEVGREHLRAYLRRYVAIAREVGAGFVFESPTWRASAGWGGELGFGPADLDRVNRRSIALMEELRRDVAADGVPTLVSGCIGPQGDGYASELALTIEDARRYHATQVETFAATTADVVTAMTLSHAEEAIGIARAAADARIPSVISFTVETDGRLPSGERLGAAIARVDALAKTPPVYYMVNCAHPLHLEPALEEGAPWLPRLRGFRGNASRCSHAELDGADTLDSGDPVDFGRRYAALLRRLPHLKVLGGCCGTDERHIAAVARSCFPRAVRA